MNDESKPNLLSFHSSGGIDPAAHELWGRDTGPHFAFEPFSTAAANASVVNTMRTLVLLMAKSMANFDNLVEVSVVTRGNSTTLVVHVDPADADRLMGKNGKTMRSMSAILDAAGKKYKAHFLLEIDTR